jgi:hypothetical protein
MVEQVQFLARFQVSVGARLERHSTLEISPKLALFLLVGTQKQMALGPLMHQTDLSQH